MVTAVTGLAAHWCFTSPVPPVLTPAALLCAPLTEAVTVWWAARPVTHAVAFGHRLVFRPGEDGPLLDSRPVMCGPPPVTYPVMTPCHLVSVLTVWSPHGRTVRWFAPQ